MKLIHKSFRTDYLSVIKAENYKAKAMGTYKRTHLKVRHTSKLIDSFWLIVILAAITAGVYTFAILRLMSHRDFYSGVLFVIGLILTVWTLYSAAFSHRVMYVTDERFLLLRPFGKFWFRSLKTELLNIPLKDIALIQLEQKAGPDGEQREYWKITLKNKSSVSFPYEGEQDDMLEAIKKLSSKGIKVKT
jgi:hypothetical protein